MASISVFTARHRGRTLLGILLGVAVLSAGLLALFSRMAPNTHAAISGCRSDPVVTLSNGVTLDLSTVVDDSSELRERAKSDLQKLLAAPASVTPAPVAPDTVPPAAPSGG